MQATAVLGVLAVQCSHESSVPSWHRLMRELVDADSASLPTASTGGDVPKQSEIVSRGNRACGSKGVCPNVTRRTKERIAQNKRARAGSLALVN